MSTATQNKIHVSDLHFENETWLSEISFFRQDLKLFESKLPQLLVANAGNDERIARIEQFQNRFIRQREMLDELYHVVHLNEQQLAEKAKEMNPAEILHKTVADHAELRNKVAGFKKYYNDFKQEFFDFIIHWK